MSLESPTSTTRQWHDMPVTGFVGEPQNLDVDVDSPPTGAGSPPGVPQDPSLGWEPPEDEPSEGPLHAWSTTGSSLQPKFLGARSVELKTLGKTFKKATLVAHGSDPADPSHVRMEIKQYRRVLGGFNFDAPPEFTFYLENDQIQVLKAFLEGQFIADGYYIRTDSKEMAQQVASMSAENLGDVLAAISDKKHLIEAIQASGHADFLADYVTNEKKRVEIGHLETAVWDKDSDEETFQKILERNPWMFGGQYVAAWPERTMVRGDQFDVPLITADGSLHLVELKKAHVSPLIRKVRNHLMVSGLVHEAVSQTQNYLRSLDEERYQIKTNFGIDPRRVHATLVIGHVDHDSNPVPTQEEIYETIRTYNSYMTRVTVMTYDQLVTNARNAIEMHGHIEKADPTADALDDDSQDDFEPPDWYFEERESDNF